MSIHVAGKNKGVLAELLAPRSQDLEALMGPGASISL